MGPNFRLVKPTQYSDNLTQPSFCVPGLCLYSSEALENIVGYDTSILGGAELFVQFKSNDYREDPFMDSVPDSDSSASAFIRDIYEELEDDEDEDDEEAEIDDTYTRNRGEIAIYAAELCARQFRTHCFSISIYGTKVRLFRWDRTGVVISNSFDICENPEILCRFLWQYTNATDAQRGFDSTITRVSEEEENIFAEIVRKHIEEQFSVKNNELEALIEEHYQPGSVFKIPVHAHRFRDSQTLKEHVKPTVLDGSEEISAPYPWDDLWYEVNKPDTESTSAHPSDILEDTPTLSISRAYSNTQYFFVSRPTTSPLNSFCRGTRGYWSVKLPDESIGEVDHVIAFVKDTWREVNRDMHIEGEVVIENVESGVKFVSDIY